jgi:hypothetical protein
MEEHDYPALYRAADAASVNAQNRYLLAVRTYSFLLIVAAGLAVYGIQETGAAIAAALVIIGSIFVSVWMLFKKDEDIWYRARAVAESVKTSTWRFMMRADPFSNVDNVQIMKGQFRERLISILNEHKDLAHALGGDLSREDQITETICDIRSMPLEQRVSFYRQHRIDEQRMWYANKSSVNKKQGQWWFGVLILCQFAAIIFLIFRVAYPSWGYWPAEVFVVGAGTALTWIQVKRFRELASAYGLTAHELGVVRAGIEAVLNEQDFAQFVIDSESAFSREHTQWLARKDVI